MVQRLYIKFDLEFWEITKINISFYYDILGKKSK